MQIPGIRFSSRFQVVGALFQLEQVKQQIHALAGQQRTIVSPFEDPLNPVNLKAGFKTGPQGENGPLLRKAINVYAGDDARQFAHAYPAIQSWQSSWNRYRSLFLRTLERNRTLESKTLKEQILRIKEEIRKFSAGKPQILEQPMPVVQATDMSAMLNEHWFDLRSGKFMLNQDAHGEIIPEKSNESLSIAEYAKRRLKAAEQANR